MVNLRIMMLFIKRVYERYEVSDVSFERFFYRTMDNKNVQKIWQRWEREPLSPFFEIQEEIASIMGLKNA